VPRSIPTTARICSTHQVNVAIDTADLRTDPIVAGALRPPIVHRLTGGVVACMFTEQEQQRWRSGLGPVSHPIDQPVPREPQHQHDVHGDFDRAVHQPISRPLSQFQSKKSQ
jgi:hypothetical protein